MFRLPDFKSKFEKHVAVKYQRTVIKWFLGSLDNKEWRSKIWAKRVTNLEIHGGRFRCMYSHHFNPLVQMRYEYMVPGNIGVVFFQMSVGHFDFSDQHFILLEIQG